MFRRSTFPFSVPTSAVPSKMRTSLFTIPIRMSRNGYETLILEERGTYYLCIEAQGYEPVPAQGGMPLPFEARNNKATAGVYMTVFTMAIDSNSNGRRPCTSAENKIPSGGVSQHFQIHPFFGGFVRHLQQFTVYF